MADPIGSLARDVRRSTRANALLYLVLAAIVIAGAFFLIRGDRARSHDARIARMELAAGLAHVTGIVADGLCMEITDSRNFLQKHPRGIPGIPPSLIVDQIRRKNNQHRLLVGRFCP